MVLSYTMTVMTQKLTRRAKRSQKLWLTTREQQQQKNSNRSSVTNDPDIGINWEGFKKKFGLVCFFKNLKIEIICRISK